MTVDKPAIAAQLRSLVRSAVGPDRRLTVPELKAAGIPSRWASNLAPLSAGVTTTTEADELADEFAESICDELERYERMTAKEIADQVPRL